MGRVLRLYITQLNLFNKRVTRVYFVLAGWPANDPFIKRVMAGWPANDPFFNRAGLTRFISCGFRVVLSGRVEIDRPNFSP